MKRRMIITIVCVLAVLASVAGVGAQATQEKRSSSEARTFTFQSGAVAGAGPMNWAFSEGQGDNTFVFVSSEMSFDGKVVKGAPYSAQGVTEMIQTLADGNRIVRRNTASVFRDGEGRTRREQTINSVGGYATSDAPQTVFINDPVAGVNYVLDSKNRTARKIDLSSVNVLRKKVSDSAKASDVEHQQKAEAMIKAEIAQATAMRGPGPGPMIFEHSVALPKMNPKNARKESLGTQTIEGVAAEGTRFTITIAAGEIGNDAPINIISESWYSPELQTVVMSKHSDPRFGENTYRLININRSEPAHSLFELPSEYTVKETIEPGMKFKVENEIRRSRGEKQDQ